MFQLEVCATFLIISLDSEVKYNDHGNISFSISHCPVQICDNKDLILLKTAL